MTIQTIIMLAVVGVVAVAAIVSLVITLVKFIKKYATAKTQAEKEAAINDLKTDVTGIIQNVEVAFDKYKVLTQGTAGADSKLFSEAKKKDAMTELKIIADSKGYDFDPDFWSDYIESQVSLMNTHKTIAESAQTTTTTDQTTTATK